MGVFVVKRKNRYVKSDEDIKKIEDLIIDANLALMDKTRTVEESSIQFTLYKNYWFFNNYPVLVGGPIMFPKIGLLKYLSETYKGNSKGLLDDKISVYKKLLVKYSEIEKALYDKDADENRINYLLKLFTAMNYCIIGLENDLGII